VKEIKKSELRNMTIEELNLLLRSAKEELARLQVAHRLRQVQNVMALRNLRRDIARILTVMREKGGGKG
jgi:large subunit ribosomal protein L29